MVKITAHLVSHFQAILVKESFGLLYALVQEKLLDIMSEVTCLSVIFKIW